MNIKIITGQQGSNLLHYANMYDGTKIEFPEVNICHSYDLCEKVMVNIQECYDIDRDLVILTYSEIVLDSLRLWVARNKFSHAECINILSDGNCITIPINENGEMEKWVDGIFDIKRIILRELLKIKRERMTDDRLF